MAGNYHTNYTPNGAGTHTFIETNDASAWVKNSDIYTIYGTDPAFVNFFDNLAAEWGDESFSLSLGFAYNNMWIVGNSKITGMKSSFGALNDANFMNFQVATVFNINATAKDWDLNGDGILQKKEADYWWLNAKGQGVDVDNSRIDWSGLKIPKGLSIGKTFAISTTKAFLKLPFETAATYGGTSFQYLGSSQVIVIDQFYHYNYRPNNSAENRFRNIMTRVGRPSGQGTDFMIYYENPYIQVQ